MACPLSVGQRVVALHPKSREVHDGSVLTVDHDKCRIQFDRPDLGVEFVMVIPSIIYSTSNIKLLFLARQWFDLSQLVITEAILC